MGASSTRRELHDLIDLRSTTLNLLLLYLSIAVWVAILLSGLYLRGLPDQALVLWFVIEAVCAIMRAMRVDCWSGLI